MVEGIRKIQTPDKTVTDIPAMERLLEANLGVLSKILGKVINLKYFKHCPTVYANLITVICPVITVGYLAHST